MDGHPLKSPSEFQANELGQSDGKRVSSSPPRTDDDVDEEDEYFFKAHGSVHRGPTETMNASSNAVSPFEDAVNIETWTHHDNRSPRLGSCPSPSNSSPERTSLSGVVANAKHAFDDEAADENDHTYLAYRFPPRESYQPLSSASRSSATLPFDDNPPAPPGLKGHVQDEDSDMPSSNTPDRRWNSRTISENLQGGERWDGSTKRGGLAPENRVEGLPKPSVTVLSPTSDQFREIPSIPSIERTHTRDESEPSSAFRSGWSTPGGGSDGEPSDDDYDWSGEEDLADQQAKFGEAMGQKTDRKGWGVYRILSLLFSTLIGSTLLSGLLITPPLIVHFYWYKPNPTPQRRYIDKNIQAWLFWVAANVTISWFIAMAIDIVPMLVQYFLLATWGHVSEAVKTRLEMYNSVKDTGKPAFYAASALSSWVIIFVHIYGLYNQDDAVASVAAYTDRLYQVVLFLFYLILIVCAQKMLSHYIAWNFHQTAYKERLEEVQKALSVIEVLQNYRPRSHKRTGTPNPFVFDGRPISEEDHYRKLSSALNSVATTHQRHSSRLSISNIPPPSSDAFDVEGTEDRERTLIYTPKKKRRGTLWISAAPEDSKVAVEEVGVDDFVEIPLQPMERGVSEKPLMSRKPAAERSQAYLSHKPTPSAISFTATAQGSSERFDRPVRPSHSGTNTGLNEIDAKVTHAAKVFKKAIFHDARNIQGRREDFLSWNVNSTTEAKRLARSVFRRLKDRYRKYLIASDFYPAFPTREEAEEAFRIFDKDNNGDLSRAEIKIKLVKTYQERRFLSRSLKDVGQALKTLDFILFIFALIIVAFISLSVFGVEIGDSLTSMYTIAIAASFIFKSSASRAFDAIMFLFVTHPYDTGDRVFIDEENLVVKKVGLFATVFSRSDGTETYFFNSQLFNKFITNARRSDKTTEMLNLAVGWKTPLAKLDALEKYLNEWLSTEEKRWFQPNTGVTLQHIQHQRYLTLTIGIPHNGNWQDWGLRNTRRTAFHAAVQYYCRQLGISAYEAPIPIVFNNEDADWTSRSDTLAQDGKTKLEAPSIPVDEIGDDASAADEHDGHGVETHDGRHDHESEVKPSLGFLPPVAFRSGNMAKARKSHRSRKNKLGAMHAEC